MAAMPTKETFTEDMRINQKHNKRTMAAVLASITLCHEPQTSGTQHGNRVLSYLCPSSVRVV